MAAHQHNYSSPRLAAREPGEGQVLYSNARRGGASKQSRTGEGKKGLPCPAADRRRLKVVSSSGRSGGERGRTREAKDEREDAEMSLRAGCPASPERGNYVVWLDPTVTFATFPPWLKERQRQEKREVRQPRTQLIFTVLDYRHQVPLVDAKIMPKFAPGKLYTFPLLTLPERLSCLLFYPRIFHEYNSILHSVVS